MLSFCICALREEKSQRLTARALLRERDAVGTRVVHCSFLCVFLTFSLVVARCCSFDVCVLEYLDVLCEVKIIG